MRKVFFMALCLGGGAGCSSRFDEIVEAAGREEAIVLEGEGRSRVLLSHRLQGRVLTTEVGSVESVGFVSIPEIREGEVHRAFNNFGGQDRFWLGPEAGQFGIYFPPGAELKREVWVVPPDLNRGPFTVVEKTPQRVRMTREMAAKNYSGFPFKVKIEREAGLIPSSRLKEELGVELPRGVSYAGSYSQNRMTNTGEARWSQGTGLLNIWILGQFEPGERTAIIAPVRPGPGAAYRDERYFGKVPPERLRVLGDAVLMRADARHETKFGIPQERTTGRAGSYDFAQDLLVVVKFDVPRDKALYGNSAWVKEQPDPYDGDVFQTYNSNAAVGIPPGRYAFYELESVSPSRELAPGESLDHRHATYCFQGDRRALGELARALLGVDLEQVEKAMFPGAGGPGRVSR